MDCQEQVVHYNSINVVFQIIHIGRHCCLWCSIKSDDLATPKSQRQTPLRTLSTLRDKHEFLRAGGNLKKAKLHENVIGNRFFDTPLTQVSLLYK